MFRDRRIFIKITLKYRENKIKILRWRPQMVGTFWMIRLHAKDVCYSFQAQTPPYLPKFWILLINLMLTYRWNCLHMSRHEWRQIFHMPIDISQFDGILCFPVVSCVLFWGIIATAEYHGKRSTVSNHIWYNVQSIYNVVIPISPNSISLLLCGR